ncbi:hypothetical protein [Filimonas effusa]|uniref:DUF4595 domain-containing protein n=1 Tax=Filimonas effusa TaxID=2508721 RepID=A0A4Q1D032_9BACT|nr:hypothetical protein [Filimonas effusa]RXK81038.1 hypothetical protein ESB13_23070 [Filimonas effusa]
MRSSVAIVLFFTILLGSCSKDKSGLQAIAPTHMSSYLLDKVEFKNSNTTAIYSYNADSTLAEVFYNNELAPSFTAYAYADKQLTRTAVNGEPAAIYSYTNGYLTTVTSSGKDSATNGYKLVFSYAPNGMLEEMQYFTADSSGMHLHTTHLYQYNIDGLPAKITSIGNSVVTTTVIHGYSEECDFDAASLMGPAVSDDLYMIYNYSLLTQLNRLPAEIVVSRAEGRNAAVVERKYNASFTITNRKLEKIKSVTTYSAHPSNEEGDEWVFHYK